MEEKQKKSVEGVKLEEETAKEVVKPEDKIEQPKTETKVAEELETAIALADWTGFKDSVDMINALINEATIHFSEEGMSLIAMDAANVAMVIFNMNKSGMTEYVLGKTKSIGINITDLKSILRRGKKGETLNIEFGDSIQIQFVGKSKKKFGIPAMELEQDKQHEIPTLDFTAQIKMVSSEFKDLVGDARFAGESMQLTCSAEHLIGQSSGDGLKSWTLELPATDEDVEIKMIGEEIKANSKFSTEYMEKITTGCKFSDKVIINLGMEYPLLVEFESGPVNMKVVLAPRIENV